MDDLHKRVISLANSMEFFAAGDETITYGEWKRWLKASELCGEYLPTEDFKVKKPEIDECL